MWLKLSLKKRVGRVNTGHEVRFCLPDFPRPWRTLEFTRDKEGTWQWRCGDKKNLISVSVLSLFSFNPRKQTRLLRRSEWLKLGNWNWARKVSSGLLTFVNNFRLALFLLRCLSTLSTQTGLDRILKLVVVGIFVLVVPFFFFAISSLASHSDKDSLILFSVAVGKLQLISASRLARYWVNLYWPPGFISKYFRAAAKF